MVKAVARSLERPLLCAQAAAKKKNLENTILPELCALLKKDLRLICRAVQDQNQVRYAPAPPPKRVDEERRPCRASVGLRAPP